MTGARRPAAEEGQLELAFLARDKGTADEQVVPRVRGADERPVVEPGSLGPVGAAQPLPPPFGTRPAASSARIPPAAIGMIVAAGHGHDVAGSPALRARRGASGCRRRPRRRRPRRTALPPSPRARSSSGPARAWSRTRRRRRSRPPGTGPGRPSTSPAGTAPGRSAPGPRPASGTRRTRRPGSSRRARRCPCTCGPRRPTCGLMPTPWLCRARVWTGSDAGPGSQGCGITGS